METQKFFQGQWVIEVTFDSEEQRAAGQASGYRIYNPDPDKVGVRRFYEVRPGQYGQPLIYEEPSLGLEVPEGLSSAAIAGEKIVGVVVVGMDGRVAQRASLSNLHKMGQPFGFDQDGAFRFMGQRWEVCTFHRCNKNRIKGLVMWAKWTDGVSPQPAGPVKIVELEDLMLL